MLTHLFEQSMLYSVEEKYMQLLKSDGMLKNKNCGLYVINMLLQKYPDGIIYSKEANHYYNLKEWKKLQKILVKFFL